MNSVVPSLTKYCRPLNSGKMMNVARNACTFQVQHMLGCVQNNGNDFMTAESSHSYNYTARIASAAASAAASATASAVASAASTTAASYGLVLALLRHLRPSDFASVPF